MTEQLPKRLTDLLVDTVLQNPTTAEATLARWGDPDVFWAHCYGVIERILDKETPGWRRQ